MGSLFGGSLAHQGQCVELLDVDSAQIDRIKSHGLTLETDKGVRVVRIGICTPEEASLRPHCLIVFTKSFHTRTALAQVSQILHEDVLVLTLQNGLGNAEKLAEFVPLQQVAVGVTTVPADRVGNGYVRSHGMGHTRMMMVNGQSSAQLKALAQVLTDAGLPSSIDHNVQSAIWQKVAFNAALNTICGVAGSTVGQLGQTPHTRSLAHRIAQEVLDVASTSEIWVDKAATHATLDDAMDNHVNHKPSMLQDLTEGRSTEIAAITGEVLRAARKFGVPVPCTETLEALVRLREQCQSLLAPDAAARVESSPVIVP